MAAPGLTIDVIVMPGANDAWGQIRQSFERAGFSGLNRFDAIEGNRLNPGTLQDYLTPRAAYELSVGRRFPFGWVHEGIPTLGAVGCYLSHLELWKRAALRNHPTLILEQDAEPGASSGRIHDAITRMPADADVAFLGHLALFLPQIVERLSGKPPAGFHPVKPTSDVFCTHAYLVTPAGAQKLVGQALPINAQVDGYMRFLCTPRQGLRAVFHSPSLIRQRRNVPSSIQPDKRNWDNLFQGGMIATRAAVNGGLNLLLAPWRIARNSLRLEVTRRLLGEEGVGRYLLRHPGILRLLIRSDSPAYQKALADSPRLIAPATSRASARTIWTYWDQGIEALPAFNQLCISTWAHHNPDWSIKVLDRTNLFEYLDPRDLPETWCNIDTAQSKSNLVRLALLFRHGGVWMDSTVLLQENLDKLFWQGIEQESLEIAGFSLRRFSRDKQDDVLETWFIACQSGSFLVRRWHENLKRLWESRDSKSGILQDPLLDGVDLKNIDNPEYLNFHVVFQALIQKEKSCADAYFTRSRVIPADNTALCWQDRHGFSRLSGLALLGNEYDAGHFASTPLLKFTGWPAGEIFARLNARDLLDPGHTLGQLLRRNLPDGFVAP